ncbi:MAG TPA: AAA family ATPase [Ktedonobacteraceae bacterium]|nr:AAA family ATPase [Ktedonobacteraceae bacterium]
MSDEGETKELIFAETKEYLRFGEFCDACRKYRYIGICHGVPGAGKTRSAREYARWDMLSPLFPEELFTLVGRRYLDDQFPHKPFATPGSPAFTEVLSCRTIYYTAPVAATPSRIEREVMALPASLSYLVEAAEQASRGKDDFLLAYRLPKRTELVIVDEAQRLKMAAIEQLRDLYDRLHFGLVLIGQPGLEKTLARYPQLYSRVGFAHQFRVLSEDETRWLLGQRWSHLGMNIRVDDFTDQEALAAIIRITGGNFRVIHRLLMQIERILEINHLQTVTKEVVEKARERLVLG